MGGGAGGGDGGSGGGEGEGGGGEGGGGEGGGGEGGGGEGGGGGVGLRHTAPNGAKRQPSHTQSFHPGLSQKWPQSSFTTLSGWLGIQLE